MKNDTGMILDGDARPVLLPRERRETPRERMWRRVVMLAFALQAVELVAIILREVSR